MKVLVVPVNFDAPLELGMAKSRKSCRHRRRIVDTHARLVECSDCGVSLDPISVLAELAREGTHFHAMRREAARLRSTIDEMKAEERRVKARLRRAKAKA